MPKALPFRGIYGPYVRETASGVSFFVQFERRDKRTRKSLTLKAKTESLAYAEAVDYGRRFECGLFDPWQDAAEAVTIREGVKRWLAHNPRLSKHTLKERRIALERFAAELPGGGTRLDARDVTADHVRAFTHAPHLKASTQDGYFSKVRACFYWLKAEGYVRGNPCDEVKKPKPRRRPPKFLSRYQYAALLSQAHSDAHTGKGPAWMPDLVELGVASAAASSARSGGATSTSSTAASTPARTSAAMSTVTCTSTEPSQATTGRSRSSQPRARS